jgi:hypothetical protein
LVDEEFEGAFDQGEFVGVVHGAGDIDEEDQVSRREASEVYFLPLESNAEETVGGVPGAVGEVGGNGEGGGALGSGVVVREVVDELFDTDSVFGGESPFFGQEAPNIAIGSGVDVDTEGRQWVSRGFEERVFVDALVGLGVGLFSSVGEREGAWGRG